MADLQYATGLLEKASLATRIANAVGTPIEAMFGLLPAGAADMIGSATHKSLTAALRFAVSTMDDRRKDSTNWIYKTVVAMTGAAGGAFGLPALAVELPVSTIVMLRSIADIARSEGESLHALETRLSCLEVFALGAPRAGDQTVESGYLAVRAVMSKALAEAAEHIASRGIAHEGAPALVRFVTQVAIRFGVPVSEKVVAQSVPVIGAAGGAVINVLFMDHFQDVARGHFIVRRLERQYDATTIQKAYLGLRGT